MNFLDKLNNAIEKNNSLVCVGLDSDFDKLPQSVKDENHEHPQFEFNKDIINATADLVCAYKPNTAFYEARGEQGVKELKLTCDYINNTYPHIPIILDAKRADIGNTNVGYMKFCYDYLNVDAVTLQPYLGSEALKPFLEVKDKGVVILCRTSNPGAGEFQDLFVIPNSFRDPQQSQDEMLKLFEPEPQSRRQVQHDKPQKLYQIVAQKVAHDWNSNNNCLLVVGATYPEELAEIRKITGDMTFLVPGVGAQGGEVEATLKAGLNSEKKGLIINSSRGIIFASSDEDFDERAREETQKLRDQINQYR